ncbi:Helicase [Spironucleus salmonicida]|uniref:Helicase n=1 Tax=Spironucleus salmonicida TaxID=348837 RepID=V6LFU7_9EUKA|nr:Helicase [Spironucleus salmonicida]|eukprot:EST43377.1 DEAD/DEAH box helicase and DSHCT (NUC185) domain-containing protein [Spironucleus salmonicida]
MEFDLLTTPAAMSTAESRPLPTIIEVPQPIPANPLKAIRHSVVFPPETTPPASLSADIFTLPPVANPAKTFPFTLDPFQEKAIAALNRGESVMVSAHTSAGKTAIAEYAISICVQRGQKVAYTSPIKALSNQKFRDLSLTYDSVGLLTGDSTVNKQAQILVMTTEILRNMLQQGGELLRELGCVVFDEVHYMRNAERGVVWEDCISQLNSKMTFVFLSATIPNAAEFAGWVCSIHGKPMHVIYTEFRPVPLQFCICPIGGTEVFHAFSSDDRQLNTANIAKARQMLPFQGGKQGGMTGKLKQKMMNETILTCLKMLKSKQILPVIVFSFGKARCEELAQMLLKEGQIGSLLSQSQQDAVELIFSAALREIDPADQQLKQIVQARQLLLRGVAVHHSGLLPFVKEVTEILFQEDLVKVIFVTETFAMGLNLPARCVVFTDLQKYDGQQNRYVQSGEFIQMAGRAGRRGLDTQGVVISFFASQDDCSASLDVMRGGAEALNSSYKIGYSQLVNYLRIEGFSAEQAISRSFLQFQRDFRLPRCANSLYQIEIALLQFEKQFSDAATGLALPETLQFLDLEELKFREMLKLMEMGREPQLEKQLVSRLVRGRILQISGDGQNFGPCVLLGSSVQGGALFLDVLAPLVAPKQYNAAKRSSEPAAVLNSCKSRDFAPSDRFVEDLLQNSEFSSFLSPKTADLDDILAENASNLVGLSDSELCRPEFKCCETVSHEINQKMNNLTSNCVFRFIMERKNVHYQTILFDKANFVPIVFRVPISCVSEISTVYVKNLPVSAADYDDRKLILTKFMAVLVQLFERQKGDLEEVFVFRDDIIPKLQFDQLENINVKYVEQQQRVQKIQELLKTNFYSYYKYFNDYYIKSGNIHEILLQILKLKRRQNLLSNELKSGSKVLVEDLKNKKLLLQHLKYFDFESQTALEKGKIASKINAVNELIVVEAIFGNLFSDASVPVFCGVVCALLGERVRGQEAALSAELEAPLQRLTDVVSGLLDACAVYGVELETGITRSDELVDRNAAQAAFLWADQRSLQEILDEIPSLFEGSVVRMFRRLVTGLEQVQEAVAGWGDGALSTKCADAIKVVNRGLVRADSLYIIDEQPQED